MKRTGGMNATSTIYYSTSFFLLFLFSYSSIFRMLKWKTQWTCNESSFSQQTRSSSSMSFSFSFLGGFGGPRSFSCSWKYILSTWNNWKIIGFVCCVVRNRIGWVGRLENFWRRRREKSLVNGIEIISKETRMSNAFFFLFFFLSIKRKKKDEVKLLHTWYIYSPFLRAVIILYYLITRNKNTF